MFSIAGPYLSMAMAASSVSVINFIPGRMRHHCSTVGFGPRVRVGPS